VQWSLKGVLAGVAEALKLLSVTEWKVVCNVLASKKLHGLIVVFWPQKSVNS